MVDHGELEKIRQQLRIMLWRVVIVRRSSWIALLFQFVLPLICPLLLVNMANTFGGSARQAIVEPAKSFPIPTLTFGDDLSLLEVLLYSPTNNLSNSIMESVNQTLTLGRKAPPSIQGYPNEDELYTEYLRISRQSGNINCAGVIFEGNETDSLTYTLRFEMRFLSSTPFEPESNSGNPGYYEYHDFANLQSLLNAAFLKKMFPQWKPGYGKLFEELPVKWHRFPLPTHVLPGADSIDILAPIVIQSGFIIIYAIIIKRLTTEKSSQIREMYKITGLIDWIYWFTHLIDVYAVFLVQAFIITLLYTFGLNGNDEAAYSFTSDILRFLILALWGFNFILSAFALSVTFNRPIFAMTVGIVFWILQTAPIYFVDPVVNSSLDPEETNPARFAACLLPNIAFTFAFNIISQRKLYGSAAGFGNLFETIAIYGSLSLGKIILILIATSVIYIALIYYLVNVMPSQYGVSKPWLFPIHSLFRCKAKKGSIDVNSNKSTNENFEPLQPSDEVKISIRKITKKFGGQQTNAVDNVSFDVPHRQVTMLLGENGAGKTTLMSMIIGMITPTRGTVEVNGHDILNETREARKALGFCPQTNISQPDLTVEQHLILYGAIKGINPSDLELIVKKILGMVRLSESMHKKPSELSGGMCRRLNLGIALIGDSEVIVLDEPTSGLDPESRRGVWDILNEIKRERTILMTTHFIEEADAVGDRIAILRSGSLACFGSPMFLKNIFGTGYELRIAKNEESSLEAITSVTKRFFPEAELGYAVGGEVIFALPQELSDNSIFFKFFQELESKKSDLKIASWGLSYTTLEDVFMRVIEFSEVKRDSRSDATMKTSDRIVESSNAFNIDHIGSNRLLSSSVNVDSGFRLNLQRLKALLIKRLQYSKRYWKIHMFQVLIPVVMFALIMSVDRYIAEMGSPADTKLNLDLMSIYGPTKGIFSNPSGGNASRLEDIFRSVMDNEQAQIELLKTKETLDSYMLEKASSLSFHDYTHEYLLSLEWNNTGPKVYFNGEATHSLPIAVDTFFEVLYRYLSGNSSSSTIFNTKSHPFPDRYFYVTPSDLTEFRPKMWTIFLQSTLPFLAASYILIPVHERSSRAKLLQIMTGLNPILYWLGHFIFDMGIHLICTIFIYGTVFTFNSQGIFSQNHMHVAFVLPIFFSGLASIPLTYILSSLFDRPAMGYSFLLILYIVFSFITSNVSLILYFSSSDYENVFNRLVGLVPLNTMAQEIGRTLNISVLSDFCGLFDQQALQLHCSEEGVESEMLRGCCTNLCTKTDDCYAYRDPLSWSFGIFKGLLEMFGVACFNFILLIVLEHCSDRLEGLKDLKQRFFGSISRLLANQWRNKHDSNDIERPDSDVLAEEIRVKNIIHSNTPELSAIDVEKNNGWIMNNLDSADQDILSVVELKKRYGNNLAVQGLSFGVHQNECFGLLGVNGAGKSTTFKMLVGDIRPTHGNGFIRPYSLVENKRKFQECIGYCPQYDALIDRLTGREMLYLFGRLRGMDERTIPEAVDGLIRDVDLARHADKITSFYSGGNKRKLSLAMALIANPRIIFLDEPSSGVDAGNRRRMWSILSAFREKGCSFVLTTHSMEECETLCSRIAIMVDGKFRCLGSLQHLRHKFAQGYSLYIKLHSDKANDLNYVNNLKQDVEIKLGAELKQHHFINLFYHIKEKSLKWSALFQIMEGIKSNHQLEDYVISDTSLEQIFIDFAKKQLSSD